MQHAHGTNADAALAMVLANPAIWRGAECAPEPAALPSGFGALDAALPGRGWPGAALTEITLEREGIGELRLVLPALVALQRDAATAARDIVWIAPPYRPYAPALAAAGLDLARLYVVHCATPQEALWAYEQALRAPECGAAFAWLATADQRLLRRLAVAAREGRTFGVLWRRPGEHAQALSAALRLQLAPWHHQLAVRVLKRRGGELTQPVLLDIERTQPALLDGVRPALIDSELAQPALLDSERTRPAPLDGEHAQPGTRAEVIPLPLPTLFPPAVELQVPATAPAHAA